MRITILTYGSRGDVHPFLPLSLRLMQDGHSVKSAAPFRFKSLIEKQQIDFVPLASDLEDLSRRLNNAGNNFVRLINELMSHTVKLATEVWRQTEQACQDIELIIHTFTHVVGVHILAVTTISPISRFKPFQCSPHRRLSKHHDVISAA